MLHETSFRKKWSGRRNASPNFKPVKPANSKSQTISRLFVQPRKVFFPILDVIEFQVFFDTARSRQFEFPGFFSNVRTN